MAHTYVQLFYHLIWSTKNRELSIPAAVQDRLHDYLGGAFKAKGCLPLQIGGMADHIHVLVTIPPAIAVAEIVRNVKVTTTKWVRDNFHQLNDFSWQEGYGAFSVSVSKQEVVKNYIQNQIARIAPFYYI